MEEKSENRKKKEFLIDNLKSLLQECKKLEKQLAGANYSRRTKFYAWIRKRQKLELIEDECHAMNLDAFDKIDLKKIVEIMCEEVLKFIPPRKRKHAQKLLINFSFPSKDLSWEMLNAISSSESLIAGNQKSQCATCTKKINWWNFLSKHYDEEGRLFCSTNCLEEFHNLLCDKCHSLISDTPYYLNKDEKEGVVCFDCINTECSQCRKIIPHSPDYLRQLLPGGENSSSFPKENKNYQSDEENFSQGKKNYLPICKSCRAKRIDYDK